MEIGKIVGFTGTRRGMLSRQRQSIEVLLKLLQPKEVHHGDCVGADEQFHRIAQDLGLRIIIHPPDNPKLQAQCMIDNERSFRLFPRPYMDRNRDIVMASDIVLAAPAEEEVQRSGTWMTVRTAKGMSKHVIVVYPEGYLEFRDYSQPVSMFKGRSHLGGDGDVGDI